VEEIKGAAEDIADWVGNEGVHYLLTSEPRLVSTIAASDDTHFSGGISIFIQCYGFNTNNANSFFNV
jgi:hypothetical protein